MASELISHFRNTLSPDNATRLQSEAYLTQSASSNPTIILDSLALVPQDDVPIDVKLIAITFVKNRIKNSWFIKQDSPNSIRNLYLPDDFKSKIKRTLIDIQFNSSNINNLILQQVVNSIDLIIKFDDYGVNWDREISQICYSNLSSKEKSSDELFIYKNLLLLKTITKKHKYDSFEERPLFVDKLVEVVFPLLEALSNSNSNSNSLKPNSIYLILKIYKYCTFTFLPPYLASLTNLNAWVSFMLDIISKFNDGDDEESQKCNKWCFANLYRILNRHLNLSNDKQSLIQHFIPAILNNYFQIISSPSKLNSLNQSSAYYLVAFITDSVRIDETWSYILQPNLNTILNLLIIPLLSCNEEIVELFEDDPQEYLRRFYDLNYDFKNGFSGSNEFIYLLSVRRFQDSFQTLSSSMNETFNGNDQFKYQAGLKIISNIWSNLIQVNNSEQLDSIISNFILPQLTNSDHKWLQTIASETISITLPQYKSNNMDLLSTIYSTLLKNFDKNEPLPLRIESADALRSLCSYPDIAKDLSGKITLIMAELLQLSNSYEFDLINEIMDDFVLRFSSNLEPFAIQLAQNLNAQFLKIAEEILNLTSSSASNDDQNNGRLNKDILDKEYQASSILTNLNTVVITMNSQRQTTYELLKTIQPSIQFIMENCMAQFITDIMEILESFNFTMKCIIPESWAILDLVLDSFENFGFDYVGDYLGYLESVVTYGFVGENTQAEGKLIQLVLKLLNENDSLEDNELVDFLFSLTYLMILKLPPGESSSQLIIPVLKFFQNSQTNFDLIEVYNDNLRNFLKIIISFIYKDLDGLINIVGSSDYLLKLTEVWFNNSDKFLVTVFDIKLQILGLIQLLKNESLNQHHQLILNKLLNTWGSLPKAIDHRVLIMKKLAPSKTIQEQEGNGSAAISTSDDEYDPEEEEDLELDELNKDTPLDSVNVGDEFKQFVQESNIQINNA